MSQKEIRVLPEHLSNKIAAGEVVRRPASVVKELLENSLDAGGDKLFVNIEKGGLSSISVSDDGDGMSERDALLSLQRHATSKIGRIEDLQDIATYGFRGEALPSIAAVSMLTMKTRRKTDDMAVVVRSSGGGATDISREGREPGTSVTVQNLFYNVPARRKFLRSNVTEFRYIYDVVQRAALSNPQISLTFQNDQQTVFDLKPSGLNGRLKDIFGEQLFGGLIPVTEESAWGKVSGFLGKPSFGQKRRGKQFLFLNGRAITNRNLNHAVFSGYEHLMLKNTYPFYLLLIEMDPGRVDVNVHPEKLEVKFEDEQGIYRFVHSLVRKSLAGADVPALSLTKGRAELSAGIRFTPNQHEWRAGRSDGERIAASLLSPSSDQTGREESPPPGGLPPDRAAQIETKGLESFSGPILQVHKKYILLQIEGGMMVVDQHVAHERVLYEQIIDRHEKKKSSSQQLLFPVTFDLSPADALLLRDLTVAMAEIGFIIKPFGGNSFVVEAVPPEVQDGSEVRIMEGLIEEYKGSRIENAEQVYGGLAKSLSCKAAVKAGMSLSEAEMRSLLKNLFATNTPFVCPHGRPTVMRLSIDELDRRFGRS